MQVSARRFRIRMRKGIAMISLGSDGTQSQTADSGDEIVVPEKTAAFLVRQRSAEIIEVIDAVTDEPAEST